MANDGAGFHDEVSVALNPPPEIPARPAKGASTEKWVDYVVALGADRTFVSEDTEHFDGSNTVTEPALSKAELVKLADRLGG